MIIEIYIDIIDSKRTYLMCKKLGERKYYIYTPSKQSHFQKKKFQLWFVATFSQDIIITAKSIGHASVFVAAAISCPDGKSFFV